MRCPPSQMSAFSPRQSAFARCAKRSLSSTFQSAPLSLVTISSVFSASPSGPAPSSPGRTCCPPAPRNRRSRPPSSSPELRRGSHGVCGAVSARYRKNGCFGSLARSPIVSTALSVIVGSTSASSKSRSARSRAPENAARSVRALDLRRRPLHRPVVVKVEVRVHVERRRNAKVVVEPVIDRPGPQRLVVIRLRLVAQPQVPLADPRRVIPAGSQHPRHRQPPRLDQVRVVPVQHSLFQPRSPAVAAGHNPVTAGRAHRRGRMHIREPHALRGEAVGIGRRNGRFRVVAAQVAPPQIIGQNVDNIGRCRSPAAGAQARRPQASVRQKALRSSKSMNG